MLTIGNNVSWGYVCAFFYPVMGRGTERYIVTTMYTRLSADTVLTRNLEMSLPSFDGYYDLRLFTWAPFQYPIRRLTVRSHKVSKARDLYCPIALGCRSACQISKRCDNLNYQSRGFETSRDLTIRRLIGYWSGALVVSIKMAHEILWRLVALRVTRCIN